MCLNLYKEISRGGPSSRDRAFFMFRILSFQWLLSGVDQVEGQLEMIGDKALASYIKLLLERAEAGTSHVNTVAARSQVLVIV